MHAVIISMVLMLFVLFIFTIFLFQKGTKRYSNIMLILYFISQIIGISSFIFSRIFPIEFNLAWVIYPVVFTWGPLFFLYVSSLLNPSFKLCGKHLLHFIPALFVIYFSLSRFYIHGDTDLFNQLNHLFNIHIIGYNIFVICLYYSQRKKAQHEFTGMNKSILFWIKISVFGFLIACSISQVSNFFRYYNVFQSGSCFFISNFSFFIFFTILFYVAITYPETVLHIYERNKNVIVPENTAKKMLARLDSYMMNNKPFIKSNLNLKTLSNEIGINERYLSYIINEYKKQNFFDFVNSYRVETAMELLSDPNNQLRTMLDILFESGFNSKTTFNTAFKKQTGITPSDFRNQSLHLLTTN